MTPRYRVERCRRCPRTLGAHFTVSGGGAQPLTVRSLAEAFDLVAKWEAIRLARGSWTFEVRAPFILLHRTGRPDCAPIRVRGWDQAAQWLSGWVWRENLRAIQQELADPSLSIARDADAFAPAATS